MMKTNLAARRARSAEIRPLLRVKFILAFVAATHLVWLPATLAEDATTAAATTSMSSEDPAQPNAFDTSKAVDKLRRGATNAGLGLSEIPKGIDEIGKKHGFGAAATWGVLHGTGRAVQRTAVGIFELLTFPVNFPNSYEPFWRDEKEVPVEAAGTD